MKKDKTNISIRKKSFLTAVIILAALMVTAFILTFVLDGMSYTRNGETEKYEFSSEGREGLAVWKFLLSPVLVLLPSSDGYLTLILIMALLIIIGGIFNSLEKCGILTYMLQKTVNKFKKKKYALLAIIILLFMALGSGIGMFEEAVPLVPIVVMLCYSLGWDSITGIGASLLAVCCGFSAGVLNPFTVGIAQSIGGITMFSGIGIRIFSFVVIYIILTAFLLLYAKKIEKNPKKSGVYVEDLSAKENIESAVFVANKAMDKALLWFISWMGIMVFCVFLAIPVRALSDYTMYIIVVCYIIAGIGASVISGNKGKKLAKTFGRGVVAILPAVLMILMAASVKYILFEANIMYTILYYALKAIENTPEGVAVLLIYLVVLVFDFIIPSGSAKAALLMPTIFPLADMLSISRQTAVLAFAFGDGFSNVIFPTNPVLLITLGLTVVSYTKWFKWSFKIQVTLLFVTSLILLFAHNVVFVV